jgi:hypothetical protein
MAIVINGTGTVTGITSITGTNATVTGITSVSSNATNTPVILQDSSSSSNTCRAWVNFNGTGTVAIRASFNVSSITDLGTGRYTVNFTNAISDTNYSVALSVGGDNGTFYPMLGDTQNRESLTTTSCTFVIDSGTSLARTDAAVCCFTLFR